MIVKVLVVLGFVAVVVASGPLLTWAIPIAVGVTTLLIGVAWTAMSAGSRWATRGKDRPPDD